MPRLRLVALLAALLAAGCGLHSPLAPSVKGPGASGYRTIALRSVNDPRLPAAGDESSLATDADRAVFAAATVQASRAAADMRAGPGSSTPPSVVWNGLTTQLAAGVPLPPPRFARAYALVHVAIHDALLAARDHDRGIAGDRSVAAGAAFEVLIYLFPSQTQRIADAAAAEMALEGDNARSQRAWLLGRAVGRVLADRGRGDGSDAVFTGSIPTGDGIWTGTNPVLPLWGSCAPWVLHAGDDVQPEPPYAFGSAADLADVDEVYQISLHRTAEQIAIVHKWADVSPPAIWNGILNQRIADRGLGTLEAARAEAFVNMAMADAFICCWKTKYQFWIARPFQRTPGLVTVITTPNFPSYTSGHSTISAAAAVVMGALFPDESAYFEGQAEEAAMSRLWGGIHFRHDNDQGLVVGHTIGAKVVAAMNQGGGAQVAER